MKKITKILIFLAVFLILIMPALSFAQLNIKSPNGGLVPCGMADSTGKITMCGFTDLMTLVNNVINFILQGMVIPIAAILFAYAGFKLITAGEEIASARTKAKSIFTDTVIGLIIAVACWLIVKLILSILGFNGAWIGF